MRLGHRPSISAAVCGHRRTSHGPGALIRRAVFENLAAASGYSISVRTLAGPYDFTILDDQLTGFQFSNNRRLNWCNCFDDFLYRLDHSILSSETNFVAINNTAHDEAMTY